MKERSVRMEKGTIFAVIITLVVITLLTSLCINIEDVPIIRLKAEVTSTDGKTTVEIVSLDQDMVSPVDSPKGTSVSFPSVDAKALINFGKGGVSYWAAKEYQGDGTYELVLGFEKDRVPKQDDVVKILVWVIDEKGDTLAAATRTMIWDEVKNGMG